ncbi:metallophosphoesterase family protein [Snuella sedimenti]|uniref:Metallophosphoesterase n=1 Tax=Snuella sedimenti TaxID=2798802 RepID=A0A8J7IHT4_9FLAO|nr:metallophosphoesterase [Snuella sedimenti]MBJ6368793.1 metallophosphoesterase [Snuella sedimenti]
MNDTSFKAPSPLVNSRRNFVKLSVLGGTALVLPIDVLASGMRSEAVEVGIIADVHQDIMHDGEQRLQVFINEAKKRNPDFIIQMGDFCRPYDHNKPFLNIWNSFNGDKHHVIGNHDMDGGFSREQVKAFWEMPANYYSFDKQGVHFVILDGNDQNPKPWKGYNRYIGKAQQEWLKADLTKTKQPTVVFSHQTLELEDGGVANLKEIQKILEEANKNAGFKKVMCCISGHHHTDFMTQINGIYYVQINSASYRWVGGDYQTIRYSKELDKTHQWIKYTIPYKESLFTFMSIKNNKIIIEPRKTEFVGLGPEELGMSKQHPHDPIVPKISKFKMNI